MIIPKKSKHFKLNSKFLNPVLTTNNHKKINMFLSLYFISDINNVIIYWKEILTLWLYVTHS